MKHFNLIFTAAFALSAYLFYITFMTLGNIQPAIQAVLER